MIQRWLITAIWAIFLLTLLLTGFAFAAPGRVDAVVVAVLVVMQIGFSPLIALTLRRPLSTWRGFLVLVVTTALFLVGLSHWLNPLPTQWHAWHVMVANIALMFGLDLVFVGATAVFILCWHGQGAKVLALGWLSFPLVWLFMANRYSSQAAMLADSVTNQLALIMALTLTAVCVVAGVIAILVSVIRLSFRELGSAPRAIPARHTAIPPSHPTPLRKS